jgi:DNA-binding response OmpR family regulator/anti-sigma regulatory factor (Ser/Thr protein kinase)
MESTSAIDAGSTPDSDQGSLPHILIVDDYEGTRVLLGKQLEGEYAIHLAVDGESALQILEEERMDLVLLDLMLPGMDGFSVCRKLKENERTCLVPVVILTARTGSDDKIQALEAGADDFLTKPVDRLELRCRVKNLIRLRTLLEEKAETERRLKMEAERHRIMRDVIHAVTAGKLVLADGSELEELRAGATELATLDFDQPTDVARARHIAEDTLHELGMAPDRLPDMVIAVSEGVTNAQKHAGGGRLEVCRSGQDVLIWISDSGGGIDFSMLPSYTLKPGASGTASLGYGFTVLMELLDRLYLSTGHAGTIMVLQMALHRKPVTKSDTLERLLANLRSAPEA